MKLRQNHQRGQSRYGGWLQSYHSFSFADYIDPEHVRFSVLRVLNDDTVQGGGGFPPHPHRDMEIISYVTRGGLVHRDSMGNGSVIQAGEFQRMSAGTGVVHSEYNVSADDEVHFFQIWIMPNKKRLTPSYDQRRVDNKDKHNRLCLVASGDDNNNGHALHIHQDCKLYVSRLTSGKQITQPIEAGRCVYVHIVEGEIDINGSSLKAGDAAGIRDTELCQFTALTESEFLLFDLP